MYPENERTVREIMKGGYDLHTHTYPSHFRRSLDDVELVRQCDAFEMAGAMLKCHYEQTASRAILVNKYGGAKAKAFGSISLNSTVGGMNPYAVDRALVLGAKMIWLPTKDSENGMINKPDKAFSRPPVRFLGDDGKPVREFYEVLEVAKKYGVYVATGHIYPHEAIIACREGLAHGVNMILTHPDIELTLISLEDQVALAREGVMVEKVWGTVWDKSITVPEMAATIRAIGPEHIFIDSDFGQADNPPPVYGIHDFVSGMLREGISKEDLKTMLCTNPARIVGE